MREVIYDTETTGFKYQEGHRLIEIAAIELIDGKKTGKIFHKLINPERDIPEEVTKNVHGITNKMVANAPKFREIIPELVEFFRGAKAIAHNADFDEKFINHELQLAGHNESFWSIISESIDSIHMSRKIWRDKKAKHSLDAVLDRCEIDRSARTLHGALIDTELLASAYSKMRDLIIEMGPTLEDDAKRPEVFKLPKIDVVKINAPIELLKAHDEFINKITPKTKTIKP